MSKLWLATISATLLFGATCMAECLEGYPKIRMHDDRFANNGLTGDLPIIRETIRMRASIDSPFSPLATLDVLRGDELIDDWTLGQDGLADGGGEWLLDVSIGPEFSDADITVQRELDILTLRATTEEGCSNEHDVKVWGGDSRIYAVVIGISEYESIEPLDSAAEDAREFIRFLEKYESPDREINIRPLIDSEATLSAIMKAMADGRKYLSDQGIFIMYFSGHGAIDLRPNGVLRASLVPREGKSREPWTMIDKRVLIDEYLANSKAARKIYILDSCFSGVSTSVPRRVGTGKAKVLEFDEAVGRFIEAARSDPLRPDPLKDIFNPPNQTIGLVSSSGNAASYEVPDIGGVFTHFLLESASQLDPQRDGDFDYRDVLNLTRTAIRDSRFSDLRQEPQLLVLPDHLAEKQWLDNEAL